MSYIEMGARAKIGNIQISSDTETSVLMTGNNSVAVGLVVGVSTADFLIVVAGNDCHLSDVRGSNAAVAVVEVTGDRAVISNITTFSSPSGAGVRLNTSNGSTVNGVNSTGDENGLVVLDSTQWQATGVYVESSDTEGVIIDGSSRGRFQGVVYLAGRHGIKITDSLKNRIEGEVVDAGRDTNNTYDGVFVDGDSDYNRTALTVSYQGSGNQMRYGLNLSVSTINNHVEASILNGAGSTGAYNDAGTGTVVTDDHIV